MQRRSVFCELKTAHSESYKLPRTLLSYNRSSGKSLGLLEINGGSCGVTLFIHRGNRGLHDRANPHRMPLHSAPGSASGRYQLWCRGKTTGL